MAGRDTPRDLQDAPDYSGNGGQSPALDSNMARAMDAYDPRDSDKLMPQQAKTIARNCFEASTNWLNSGRRLKWTDSLRAFQNLHPTGSKYLSGDYKYRSRLFRPKTRSMVRKGEAATAAAFFSNDDVVNIQPQNDDDKMQLASSKVIQALLQYRLTKTIPWFLTLVGARQDCEVMGICIGKAYWKYAEQYTHTESRPVLHPVTGEPMMGEDGTPLTEDYDQFKKLADHPWVDLTAPENFRFDPGADWRDPVATSPYIIEIIPMYIADVRAKIDTGEWLPVAESALMASNNLDDDVTRRAREQERVPGKDADAWRPREFDICWIRENVIRYGGRDWHFYSVSGSGELLSRPMPIEDIYFQGVRPWVCGFIVPEAHKTYPSGKVELVRDLQTQTNDVTNLRLDNVKLALNPRQFLRAGSGADPQDARIFNPGKIVILKDPNTDIKWDRPPDVTAGAYQEQDRINMDFDELAGGTSNASIQANQQAYQAVGNTEIMQGNATTLEEYEQRVFAETFVEKIIRQLVKLEQKYETDPVVLTIAGNEAQLFQKFGMNQITDELLQQELTIKVNVGIGATNPTMRLKNFMTAADAIGKMFGPAAAMGANFQEVVKEVFGLCGYKDGERFFQPNFNPQQAMAQMQSAKGKGAQHPQQPPQQQDQSKVQAAQINTQGKLQEKQIDSQTDLAVARMEYAKEQLHEQGETQRAMINARREMMTMPQPHAQAGGAAGVHPMLAGLMGAPHAAI